MNIKNISLLLLQGALVMTLFVAAPMSANAAETVGEKASNTAETVGEKVSDTAEKVGDYLDDAAVTAAVKGKFIGQKGVDSMDISVDTAQGVVTLTGVVDNSAQKELAEKLAMETKGVVRVVNSLTVKQ